MAKPDAKDEAPKVDVADLQKQLQESSETIASLTTERDTFKAGMDEIAAQLAEIREARSGESTLAAENAALRSQVSKLSEQVAVLSNTDPADDGSQVDVVAFRSTVVRNRGFGLPRGDFPLQVGATLKMTRKAFDDFCSVSLPGTLQLATESSIAEARGLRELHLTKTAGTSGKSESR